MNTIDFELSALDYLSPGDKTNLRVPVLDGTVQFRNFSPDLSMGSLKISAGLGSVAISLEDVASFQVVDWLRAGGNNPKAGEFFERNVSAIVMERNTSGLWLPDTNELKIRPGLEDSFERFVDMAVASAVEKLA